MLQWSVLSVIACCCLWVTMLTWVYHLKIETDTSAAATVTVLTLLIYASGYWLFLIACFSTFVWCLICVHCVVSTICRVFFCYLRCSVCRQCLVVCWRVTNRLTYCLTYVTLASVLVLFGCLLKVACWMVLIVYCITLLFCQFTVLFCCWHMLFISAVLYILPLVPLLALLKMFEVCSFLTAA